MREKFSYQIQPLYQYVKRIMIAVGYGLVFVTLVGTFFFQNYHNCFKENIKV